MNRQMASLMLRHAVFKVAGLLPLGWRDYSRLIVVGDRGGWVLDEEMANLCKVCRQIGIRTVVEDWERVTRRQCVFHANRYALLNLPETPGHRICFPYYHGKPGTGSSEFDDMFKYLRDTRDRWARIQVSHSEMQEIVLSTGIAPERVRRIPIAIRIELFHVATAETQTRVRNRLGIPANAFVLGSFQKDGIGWGEGVEPKLIKGPDVLVKTLRALKGRIPELFVLLCGPARGFVKRGLTEAGVPFCHVHAKNFEEIAPLYHALDAYLVTSRQEGGPKAVLESMASGVPLVTTRVGQAMDLVKNGENGFMVDVEDVDGLAHSVERVRGLDDAARRALLRAGRDTAEANAWSRQGPLWKDFFAGVVE